MGSKQTEDGRKVPALVLLRWDENYYTVYQTVPLIYVLIYVLIYFHHSDCFMYISTIESYPSAEATDPAEASEVTDATEVAEGVLSPGIDMLWVKTDTCEGENPL